MGELTFREKLKHSAVSNRLIKRPYQISSFLIVKTLVLTRMCAVDEQINTTPELCLIGSREVRELFATEEEHERWSRPNLICSSDRLRHSNINLDTLDLTAL